MSHHATPSNVSNLAVITQETAQSLAEETAAIATLSYNISTPELLDATFSDLASRLDNISAMADQFTKLRYDLENALTTPAPTP